MADEKEVELDSQQKTGSGSSTEKPADFTQSSKEEKGEELEKLKGELSKKEEQIRNLNIALHEERTKKKSLDELKKEAEKLPEEPKLPVEPITPDIQETVKKEVHSILFKGNEKEAIKRIIEKFPELANTEKFNEVLRNYSGHRGKETSDDIYNDLLDAYIITNRDKLSDEAFQKGLKQGFAKSYEASIASSGGGTPQGQEQTTVLTPLEKKAAEKGRIPESDYIKQKDKGKWDEEVEFPA